MVGTRLEAASTLFLTILWSNEFGVQKDLGAAKNIHGRAFVPSTGPKSL